MDGLCLFLNEPLKDDFMSGYSQMAGLAAASLAGELQGFRFECLLFTSPKVLLHWNHSSAKCSWRNWTAKIHEPTLKHCPGPCPPQPMTAWFLHIMVWILAGGRWKKHEETQERAVLMREWVWLAVGVLDLDLKTGLNGIIVEMCRNELGCVFEMFWSWNAISMISIDKSRHFTGGICAKNCNRVVFSYQPHITWSHLFRMHRRRSTSHLSGASGGPWWQFLTWKNSARWPRGLEPFLPGGTKMHGSIRKERFSVTKPPIHATHNKVQIHLQALELFEHIMRGRVQDDVVDFPGLPRMFSSSPILELDQKQILTSVACPDRASAPFPDDVAVSTLECILGNQV